MMCHSSLLDTYTALAAVAESAGLRVISRDAVQITGDIPEAFMKRSPDYAAIRKALNSRELPWAKLVGVEYSLVVEDVGDNHENTGNGPAHS